MGIATCIPRATDDYNNFHADFMAKAHIAEDKEEYVFTDVAYKPNCAINMIEESQPLRVALKIAEAGKKVKISDREGIISMVRREFGPVFEYEVLAPTAAAGGVTADVMESSVRCSPTQSFRIAPTQDLQAAQDLVASHPQCHGIA